MLSTSSLLLYASVVFVACIAVLLGLPQPKLDWDGTLLPMARAKFPENTIGTPPLDGVIAVVTGSTSGIGLELSKTLVTLGATVVALTRNSLPADLQHNVNVEPIHADLNDLESVSKAANEILERFHHVDVLFNNAGIHYGWTTSGHPTSVQGYDQAFAVNYLSHFLLTEKLLPLLKNSTRPTVVSTSSSLHWAVNGSDLMMASHAPLVSRPDPDTYPFLMIWKRDQRAYSNSKLAQILHARVLNRKFDSIRFVSICPGWVGTQLAGRKGSFKHFLLNTFSFDANEWGIVSLLYAMLDDTSSSDYYTTSTFPHLFHYLSPLWKLGTNIRHALFQLLTFGMVIGQKLTPHVGAAMSSPESYNETLQESLYEWSKEAVAEFL